jgi:hypothetical protein
MKTTLLAGILLLLSFAGMAQAPVQKPLLDTNAVTDKETAKAVNLLNTEQQQINLRMVKSGEEFTKATNCFIIGSIFSVGGAFAYNREPAAGYALFGLGGLFHFIGLGTVIRACRISNGKRPVTLNAGIQPTGFGLCIRY